MNKMTLFCALSVAIVATSFDSVHAGHGRAARARHKSITKTGRVAVQQTQEIFVLSQNQNENSHVRVVQTTLKAPACAPQRAQLPHKNNARLLPQGQLLH